MKFCDLTSAYTEYSGGIRTYIDEKRRYLMAHTTHEHLLIIPGKRDRLDRQGRCMTVHIESPLLPGQDSYRLFLRPDKIKEILTKQSPDVIELGSYYLCPWAAFAYRRRCRDQGRHCLVGGYFHTDVAKAYVDAPLRTIAHDWFDDWSDTLAETGEKLADIATIRVERYIRKIFNHCDLALASSPAQAARLQEYGVEGVQVVPMGVDLETFHPFRRNDETRRQHGAMPDNVVLVFAGRLCTEKRVLALAEMLTLLPEELRAVLWIVGEGPLHDEIAELSCANPSIHLLPYQEGREEFANLLASADIYVTAGPHETFALSVIEAQACGLPVVGVDAGALRERVPHGLGFLGPVDDTRAMADNIVRAARKREALGRRARAHVERTFSWGNTFRKLVHCYTLELEEQKRLVDLKKYRGPAGSRQRSSA